MDTRRLPKKHRLQRKKPLVETSAAMHPLAVAIHIALYGAPPPWL